MVSRSTRAAFFPDQVSLNVLTLYSPTVDGTLFTDDHELHPTTLNAIRHIRETRPDLPIIPVTGKQRVSCA